MIQAPKIGRALIVDDEFLVAMHVETVLEDLGFADIAWANSLKAAEAALEEGLPAFAVLDINIGQDLVFPLAEKLVALGVPFVFCSGANTPPPRWADHPFIPKPMSHRALASIVEALHPTAPPAAVVTLGDVLYADSRSAPPERDWRALIHSIAAGDEIALHRLYERAHGPVVTLLTRMTGSRRAAEDLSIDVFHQVWRSAGAYGPNNTSTLGWIMNLARARALEYLRSASARSDAALEQASPALRDTASFPDHGARLQARLSMRIALETGRDPVMAPSLSWCEPQWEAVAPGIECKLLAGDDERNVISMLVRLEPGASYPPHTHAGPEELHLLEGELWIDDRMLVAGDYNFGPPGGSDERVWSETGCACVLVTSTKDVLR